MYKSGILNRPLTWSEVWKLPRMIQLQFLYIATPTNQRTDMDVVKLECLMQKVRNAREHSVILPSGISPRGKHLVALQGLLEINKFFWKRKEYKIKKDDPKTEEMQYTSA